jgi:hypothetical protein
MYFPKQHLRAGWVKYLVLAAATAGAGAAGLYLSGAWTDPAEPAPVVSKPQPGQESAPDRLSLQRFPLTALDAKDQIEAPSLAADAAGHIFLAWASKTSDNERTVFLARTTDAARPFDAPKEVAKAAVYRSVSRTTGKVGYERRATPHVVVQENQLHLAWSEALPDGSSMRMVVMSSADAGATFDAVQQVHKGDHAKATFTGMAIGPGEVLACTWLDDRAGFQQPYAATRLTGRARFEPEELVHAGQEGLGVCPCCPTAAVFAPDGTLFVAFRNVSEGYRDIAVSRKKPGQAAFEAAVSIIPPAWKFDGCPHDGPSLAVAGSNLHVVWMDARSGPQRCYYAKSDLNELKFEARELHAISSGTQGNARLLADEAGGLHAVWEESLGVEPEDTHAGHQHGPPKTGTGGGRAIMYAFQPAGKLEFGPASAVAPKAGAFQSRPALVTTPTGDLLVAWNELDEAGKAVVVTHRAVPRTRGDQP